MILLRLVREIFQSVTSSNYNALSTVNKPLLTEKFKQKHTSTEHFAVQCPYLYSKKEGSVREKREITETPIFQKDRMRHS